VSRPSALSARGARAPVASAPARPLATLLDRGLPADHPERLAKLPRHGATRADGRRWDPTLAYGGGWVRLDEWLAAGGAP
jgi:hypothetical protein